MLKGVDVISQTARYALRILGLLAAKPERWALGKDIAAETGIPANYLSKILNQLRKRGLVQSQKGWGGGFLVERRTLGTPIGEVVEVFDGKADNGRCVFELQACDAEHPCPLHHWWDRVRREYQAMLTTVTIGDLGQKG
ncbi:MAG: Rrf2 family transcriptional regulator [Thermoanaerobaculaceae bacterium]|nr:Rrf2 family transcriptional regulator [Thermoanaerobaculaceae bacterium]MDI9621660.1 Rrf2 family transcriptional regulator [Acidobacteriota bacterium]NLH11278.1 Rrf2 family transcriptional regulator [Holophagae bacterium]